MEFLAQGPFLIPQLLTLTMMMESAFFVRASGAARIDHHRRRIDSNRCRLLNYP
jgi:hypothetical protein